MLLDFCALFPKYVRHSNAVKLLSNLLCIVASFRMFVIAMAAGLVPGERQALPELVLFAQWS